ncbi:ATP-binding protein [Prauserella sp. PE36]|uniref:DUF2075 domain-containing protein n=1 Tax=Prauserella sp. PE36 TaxID=1504709 RepID=UPI000DE40EC5|nr:DUF2075 domain-containing protein [Prauserella sp. PE36]RBM16234.1 ATP-binding protein [Prauserella sp. PE36]
MALIRGKVSDLLVEAQAGQLHQRLHEQARFQLEHRVGHGEVTSWARSLPILLNDLADADLGHVEVLLEHKLPHSPKRVDAVLCGSHPRTGEATYVLVELKQWSRAELETAELVHLVGYGQPVLHPVEQVRRYCEYLVDETPALADRPNAVHGVAYLHNARNSGIATLLQYEPTPFGRLFTLDDRAAFVEHLRGLLDPDGERDAARDAAEMFLNFRHAPAKPLLDLAAKEIREREQFVLLDEQQVAYRTVLNAVERARRANTRTVVIVLGGPGSGKSVIALSLLGDLARRGLKVHHATGSGSFTRTLRKIAGSRNSRVQALFKFFHNYIDAEPRALDVIVCDEAHRIREQSVNRYTKRELRERARPQVDELIEVAWTPVFLLDEHQTVRPGELGSEEEIAAAARAVGCEVEVVHLSGQFRCGGSAAYDEWVARLLGIAEQPPVSWSEIAAGLDDDFRVNSAVNPAALESWLLHQRAERSGTARLAAGYCWPWSDPVRTGDGRQLVLDVRIGDWARPWNAKPQQRVPDAPESHYWASDERGFGQVGCVYTAQGFEYDWAGVIFGPDFVWRTDRWVAVKSESRDPQVKRADDRQFAALIRNTYKVLLTRGMQGVCVYSTDPETQEFLESMAR